MITGSTEKTNLIPFLMGLRLFHEQATSLRLTGVGAVLTALFLFACAKSDHAGRGRGWLISTLAAFALSGRVHKFIERAGQSLRQTREDHYSATFSNSTTSCLSHSTGTSP